MSYPESTQNTMNTNEKFVITISRELGSGGHTIGRTLARTLGVRFCDKDLIHALRKEFGLSTYEIERIKGEKKNWLESFLEKFSPITRDEGIISVQPDVLEDWNRTVTTEDVFEAESKILQEMAAEGSCVIAGRSGFFVLDEHPNKLDIFITASLDKRIARVVRKQGLNPDQAKAVIESVDQARENYVKRFAGTSRYDLRNYDLVLNVDHLDEEQAVACILNYMGVK